MRAAATPCLVYALRSLWVVSLPRLMFFFLHWLGSELEVDEHTLINLGRRLHYDIWITLVYLYI